MRPILRSLRLAALAPALLVAAAPFACGVDHLGGAGGSGGGGGEGTGGACVQPGEACAIEFVYPLGNEHAVELRGDFAPGAWDQGVPMALDGAQWTTPIAATEGQTIQYKFFVDGTTW